MATMYTVWAGGYSLAGLFTTREEAQLAIDTFPKPGQPDHAFGRGDLFIIELPLNVVLTEFEGG